MQAEVYEDQMRTAESVELLNQLRDAALAEVAAIPNVATPEQRFRTSFKGNAMLSIESAYKSRLHELTHA